MRDILLLALSAPLATLFLAGCGGNVVDSGTGASTTTSTSTSTGTFTTTSTFTTTFTGTTTSTVTGTTTTSTVTNTSCGQIELSVDSGPLLPLTSICDAPNWNPSHSTVAIGYLVEGGPPPGVSNLEIQGCTSSAPGAQGIQLSTQGSTGAGNFMNGSAVYTDGMGGSWKSVQGKYQVSIGTFGPVGQDIDGKFFVEVTDGNQAHSVSGGIHVCHVQDELVP